MHRHRWINAQGGKPLSGRVPNGTIRVCFECQAQQVKSYGRWVANLVRTAVSYPDPKEAALIDLFEECSDAEALELAQHVVAQGDEAGFSAAQVEQARARVNGAKYRNPLGLSDAEMYSGIPGWLLTLLDSDDVQELRSTSSLCSDRFNIALIERRIAQLEGRS
jgi:hypothetical protein